MIRTTILALLLTGCVKPGGEAIEHCKRSAPPWGMAECYEGRGR
jgi:hypothetical protein